MQPSRPKVGLLDLDIFGPSVPRIMGLTNAPEPEVNKFNHMVPLKNHGLQVMSMGFLLSREADVNPRPDPTTPGMYDRRESSPVVWRGLMVQKATQQLLFEVDWSGGGTVPGGIDVLVVDMPPGTGDVALTLGQLVRVDGAVIVSTAQDVALADVKKGVAMFNRVKVPMLGLLLNMSHYVCPSCHTPHTLFGPSASVEHAAEQMSLPLLGKLPIVSQLSWSADRGVPLMLQGNYDEEVEDSVKEAKQIFSDLASLVYRKIQ